MFSTLSQEKKKKEKADFDKWLETPPSNSLFLQLKSRLVWFAEAKAKIKRVTKHPIEQLATEFFRREQQQEQQNQQYVTWLQQTKPQSIKRVDSELMYNDLLRDYVNLNGVSLFRIVLTNLRAAAVAALPQQKQQPLKQPRPPPNQNVKQKQNKSKKTTKIKNSSSNNRRNKSKNSTKKREKKDNDDDDDEEEDDKISELDTFLTDIMANYKHTKPPTPLSMRPDFVPFDNYTLCDLEKKDIGTNLRFHWDKITKEQLHDAAISGCSSFFEQMPENKISRLPPECFSAISDEAFKYLQKNSLKWSVQMSQAQKAALLPRKL